MVSTIANRKKSFYAAIVPDRNFQRLGNHPIAADAQGNLPCFSDILEKYHARLYRGDFTNPVKPGIRGAYMLDQFTAFQEDRLHRIVQIVGTQSRDDGFHLLNAYHIYGVKSDPGFHFDVMKVTGAAIGHILTDVLTGKATTGAESHLNATPCDRLL